MSEKTILIVDDSEAVRRHVQHVLDNSPKRFQTLIAKNGLEGFKIMVSRPVDLVLCDVMMPVLDGFKLLNLKRTRPELQDVPVIMLTAAEDVNQKVKALESGAQDYLTKPFHDAELVARVSVHVEVRTLQRELRLKNEQLELLSNTDGLTKLTNRRHFMELADIELLRADQERHCLAVVMLDIDHFKQVNDTHGHAMGDTALRAVAEVLNSDLRDMDVAARYGGEEFVLLLPDTDTNGAAAVAERYRSRIAALHLQEHGRTEPLRVSQYGVSLPAYDSQVREGSVTSLRPGNSLPVSDPTKAIRFTSSFGVAVFPSNGIQSIDDLMRTADQALYQAKRTGRNKVCLAEPEQALEHYKLSGTESGGL
jgi:diguanylate cyclase (GGDEF)-like protein